MDYYFKYVLNSQNINTMNVFINLDDILHKLHKPLTNNEFQAAGKNSSKQLISNILNVISHYRLWFVNKGIKCRMFVFYTASYKANFRNEIYIPRYRKKFREYNDELNTKFFYINTSFQVSNNLLSVMGRYLEDIYIINTKLIEPSVFPFYIASEGKFQSDWNVIISRDLYDLQYSYMDRWSYLYPKGNYSQFINKSNLWEFLRDANKVGDITIHPYDASAYVFVLAVIGDTWRNIPRLKRIGWKTMFKILEAVYNEIQAYDRDISTVTYENMMLSSLVSNKTDVDSINRNLEAVSVKLQYEKIGEIDRTAFDIQMEDIPDINSFQEMNKLYFNDYPINLIGLTARPDVTKRNSNKKIIWK